MSLTGKRVLVTGGNRGLGLSVVKAMAAAGAEVFAWGRDQEALALAAQMLQGSDGACHFHQVDVCDESAVVTAIEAMGPVDILVNNAAIARSTAALETPTQEIQETLAINVTGAFVVMREIAKGMVASGGGLIINVASDAAIAGIRTMGPYAASKHALLGLGRSFSLALREQGVRVTTFCPGSISTDIMKKGTVSPDSMNPDSLAELLVNIASLDPKIEIQDLLVEPMPPKTK